MVALVSTLLFPLIAVAFALLLFGSLTAYGIWYIYEHTPADCLRHKRSIPGWYIIYRKVALRRYSSNMTLVRTKDLTGLYPVSES